MTKTPTASRRKPVAQAIVQAPSEDQALPSRGEFDLHIPLSSRAVFWRPRHLAASTDLELLPSLFWLVESIRPSRSVQIGLGDGVAYLALCQAIDKLGIEASAAGLEPRPNLPPLPVAMAEQHDMGYRDFSMVVSADPAEAARRMTNAAIDLMVINCPLDAALIESLSTLWLPHLSSRAVIAVLNPHLNADSPEARALLEPYIGKGKHFLYDQGENGLLLCLAGAAQPDRLRRLATLEQNEPGFMAAMQVFRRLGDALSQEWRVIEQGNQTAEAQLELTQTKTKLNETNSALTKARAATVAALEGERQQAAQLATLQARLFDAEEALGHYRTQDETADQRLAREQQILATERQRLEEERLRLRGELQQQKAQAEADLQNRDARYAALETEMSNRIEDILSLCESHKDALSAAEAKAQSLVQELAAQDTLRAQLAKLAQREINLEAQHNMRIDDIVALNAAHSAEIAQLEKKIHFEQSRTATVAHTMEAQRKAYEQEKHTILGSTSWKVTRPLRGIGNTMRRRDKDK